MVMIKELRSGIKIGKFYIKDIAFVVGYFVFFFLLRSFVSGAVLVPYLIFNFVVAVILVMPSVWNPGKQMWQSILFVFQKDRRIYKEHGTEEIKEKLANNEISLNTAENVAHLSPAQQTKIIAGEAAAVTPAKVEKLKAQNENRTKSKALPSDADIKGYYIPSLKSKAEYIAQKAAEVSLTENENKKLLKALEAVENMLDKIIKIIEK